MFATIFWSQAFSYATAAIGRKMDLSFIQERETALKARGVKGGILDFRLYHTSVSAKAHSSGSWDSRNLSCEPRDGRFSNRPTRVTPTAVSLGLPKLSFRDHPLQKI